MEMNPLLGWKKKQRKNGNPFHYDDGSAAINSISPLGVTIHWNNQIRTGPSSSQESFLNAGAADAELTNSKVANVLAQQQQQQRQPKKEEEKNLFLFEKSQTGQGWPLWQRLNDPDERFSGTRLCYRVKKWR